MSRENAEVVRRAVEAFNEGGWVPRPRWTSSIRRCVRRTAGAARPACGWRARESVSQIFTQFDAAWEEHRTHPNEIRAIDDERVLLLSRDHFRATTESRLTKPPGRSSRFAAAKSHGCRRSGTGAARATSAPAPTCLTSTSSWCCVRSSPRPGRIWAARRGRWDDAQLMSVTRVRHSNLRTR
jgi:hypothetical protein